MKNWRKTLLRGTCIVVVLGAVLASFDAVSQNLETIGKEKPLTVTGGISANQIFYTAQGIESRRDPYSWFLNGNINFSLYGWSIPLSFSYSNQQVSFQQPFNQYSIHPTYKWITGHIGYTSMSFSPYTVNGHIFLGAGVDVAPEGKWKFSALYGRFLKAVEADTLLENVIPSYKRMGYGFKASYGDNGNFADIILFHAEDDKNSIAAIPDSLSIFPEENLVLSIGAGKTFFNHFVLRGEFATSAITRDVRTPKADHNHPLAQTSWVYQSRTSSSYYNAFKAALDFQQDYYTIGIGYERIAPQYRTLGAYFFNNDLENITINGATTLLQDKVNIAASAGTQRDNLDNSKISTLRRMVGSLNINYTPSEKLNLSSSYSTFQSFTNIRSQFVDINQLTPYDNLDTLNFTQLSTSASLNALWAFGRNDQRKQNLNFNLNYQKATDKQDDVIQNTGMRFYNFNTMYSVSFVPQQTTLSLSFNTTINQGAISSETLGPTAAVSKALLEKKLRATLSSAYNHTYSGGTRINSILNFRLNGSLTLQKKHNITTSVAVVNRDSRMQETSRSFTEYTGTLGYSYSFGIN